MPKVGQLRTRLHTAIDDTTSPANAWDLFNSALRELAVVSRIPSKAIIPFPTVSSVLSVSLPTDISELRRVDMEFTDTGLVYDMDDIANIYGLSIYEGTAIEWNAGVTNPITSVAGRFVVRYYRYPIMITGDDDTPEIPEIFHDALVFYAAKEFFQSDDELQLASVREAQYLKLKDEFDIYTQRRVAGTTAPAVANPRPPWARR